MKLFWLAIAVVTLTIPGLGSADYYRYETENGSLAFTDDEKRIPARYREGAAQEKPQNLYDYSRLTIVSREAEHVVTPSADETEAQLSIETFDSAGEGMRISTNPSTTTFDVREDATEPLLIERYTEWRWVDGHYVPHAVVKKNGRVVSIVRLR